MISKSVKNTKFFSELSVTDCNKFFDFKRDKFFHNIDSIYYMIKVKNNWLDCEDVRNFISILEALKVHDQKNNDITIFPNTDFIVHGRGLPMYPYSLELPNKYSVFIVDSAINNTPEIWVQIRSEFLWLYGEHFACLDSIKTIEKLLSYYGIWIHEVKENRIDYAYHTNYIQDPLNFFKEDKLNSMQVSRFKRYSFEGCFKGSDEVYRDYITLGRKKSNNVFFRVYDKTKEVVERSYKQFFIPIWFNQGLINYYDKYCLEHAFNNSDYGYLHKARLEFYIKYGNDNKLKNEILKMFNNKSSTYYDYELFANSFMPRVTIICNVEIETKRKFYSSLDESVDKLLKLVTNCPEHSRKLFVKLDNKKSFHTLLTNDVIRFVNRSSSTRKSRCDTAPWWLRLQQVKMFPPKDLSVVELERVYQTTSDVYKLKDRALKSIASLSLYLNDSDDKDIRNDVVDIMSLITENDVQSIFDYKQKKFALESNMISHTNLLSSQSRYAIVDLETGEMVY